MRMASRGAGTRNEKRSSSAMSGAAGSSGPSEGGKRRSKPEKAFSPVEAMNNCKAKRAEHLETEERNAVIALRKAKVGLARSKQAAVMQEKVLASYEESTAAGVSARSAAHDGRKTRAEREAAQEAALNARVKATEELRAFAEERARTAKVRAEELKEEEEARAEERKVLAKIKVEEYEATPAFYRRMTGIMKKLEEKIS